MQRKSAYMRTPTSILKDNIHITLNQEERNTEAAQGRAFHIGLKTYQSSEITFQEARSFSRLTERPEEPFMLVFRDSSLENLRQVRSAFQLHPVIDLEFRSSPCNVKDTVLSFENSMLISFAELTDEEDLERTCCLKLILLNDGLLCIASQASYTLNSIGKQLSIAQLCSNSGSISAARIRKMSLPPTTDISIYYGLSSVEAILFRIFHVNISRFENYVLKLLSEAMFTSVYASEISYHERVDFIWRLSITNKSLIHLSDLIRPKSDLFTKLRRSEVMSAEFAPYLESLISRCQSMEQRIDTAKELLKTSERIYSASADDYLTSISNRMNEVMQVFSAIATIFLPLNLIAGLFGMNIAIPGQDEDSLWPFAVIIGSCVILAVTVLGIFFRKKLL
jgi:Mg2+ and Co2+ transporter CorA